MWPFSLLICRSATFRNRAFYETCRQGTLSVNFCGTRRPSFSVENISKLFTAEVLSEGWWQHEKAGGSGLNVQLPALIKYHQILSFYQPWCLSSCRLKSSSSSSAVGNLHPAATMQQQQQPMSSASGVGLRCCAARLTAIRDSSSSCTTTTASSSRGSQRLQSCCNGGPPGRPSPAPAHCCVTRVPPHQLSL